MWLIIVEFIQRLLYEAGTSADRLELLREVVATASGTRGNVRQKTRPGSDEAFLDWILSLARLFHRIDTGVLDRPSVMIALAGYACPPKSLALVYAKLRNGSGKVVVWVPRREWIVDLDPLFLIVTGRPRIRVKRRAIPHLVSGPYIPVSQNYAVATTRPTEKIKHVIEHPAGVKWFVYEAKNVDTVSLNISSLLELFAKAKT